MFERTLQFLDGAPLGLFGVGHLGQTIAEGLLAAGFPPAQLIVCHDGSTLMNERMAAAGLTRHVVAPADLAQRARILIYMIHPQDSAVLGAYTLRPDCLLLSCLAGVLLERLPVELPMAQRARLLPSAPATIRTRDGYCGVYPAGHAIAGEIVQGLGMRVAPMRSQDDFHAFTGLAMCLPTALVCWEAQGRSADEAELSATAARWGVADYAELLAWARRVQPQGLTDTERARYVAQGATPGGITEAIVRALEAGAGLAEALEIGTRRSQELGRA